MKKKVTERWNFSERIQIDRLFKADYYYNIFKGANQMVRSIWIFRIVITLFVIPKLTQCVNKKSFWINLRMSIISLFQMYLTSQLRLPYEKRTKAPVTTKDSLLGKGKASITMWKRKNSNMKRTRIMRKVLKRKARRSNLNFM